MTTLNGLDQKTPFAWAFTLLFALAALFHPAGAGADDAFLIGPPQQVPAPVVPPMPRVQEEGDFIEAIDFDGNAATTGLYQIPPDAIAAAGPAHLVNVVNTSIEWYAKDGTRQSRQALRDFFAVLDPLDRIFDPKVIYDQHDGRFVVVVLDRTDNGQGDPANDSRLLLAVSQTADPNAGWRFSAVPAKLFINGLYRWADYPGLAVGGDAVYLTANMFAFGTGSFGGVRLWIVHKNGFYSGGTLVSSDHGLDPVGTAQPAHVFGTPPAGVGTFLVQYGEVFDAFDEYAVVTTVYNPLTSPVLSRTDVNVGDIDEPRYAMPDAPQPGTGFTIETNDHRALHAVWRENSLWFTAQVIPQSGVDEDQATAHFWELDTGDPSAPVLLQQGNVGGEDIAPGAFTYYPSIAVDDLGNVGIGFSASAETVYPGAYFASRAASDPPGEIGPSQVVAEGLDFYFRRFNGYRNRWGDYSGIALDPADGLTFWVYNEYALERGTVLPDYPGQDGRWGTRYKSFLVGGGSGAAQAPAMGVAALLAAAALLIVYGRSR